MASFLSRIVRFVRGIFKSTPAQVAPSSWRPATKSELKTLGFSPTSRRYVPKRTKKVSKKTPTISVRSYQQAQQQKTLEQRRKAYATGALKRKHRVRYGVRFKGYPGKIKYQNIPWHEVPHYFDRSRKYKHVQIAVLARPPKSGGHYEEVSPGLAWFTIFEDGSDELPDIYNRVNSIPGFFGLSDINQPVVATLTFWK